MMKKIKTTELVEAALDYAVALALGHSEDEAWIQATSTDEEFGRHCYSSDPKLAWPIIDAEGIGLFCNRTAAIGSNFKPNAGADWRAFAFNKHGTHYFGPTSLVAAMRCFVASKLGDEVEIPEELLS